MGDLATAGGGQDPLTRKAKDKTGAEVELKFAELSFYDRRNLSREYRKIERDKLVALLDQRAVDENLKTQELWGFDNEVVGENVWNKYFNSDDGKLEILQTSLIKAGTGPTEAKYHAENYCGSPIDVAMLCAAITHTPIEPLYTQSQVEGVVAKRVQEELAKRGLAEAPAKDEGSGSANPTAPKPPTSTVGFGKLAK